MSTKKVFISYSWQVQDRVVELADRLIANGVDVVIDVYDLSEGQDKYAFMEQSVNDPSIDRVLIICDESYTNKANSRTGGVGDETVIISPEIYGNAAQEKFIPVIFENDIDGHAYCPHYIKSRIYIDLSSEVKYEEEYEKLLRNIYEKPFYKKPALGKMPEWLDEKVNLSAIRDTIKQIRGCVSDNSRKREYLVNHARELFIGTAKEYSVSGEGEYEDLLLKAIDQMKDYRDVFVDYLDSLLYADFSLPSAVTSFFEGMYNEYHRSYSRNNEEYDYLMWELFISTAAFCLYYERYKDLYDILTHTYFVKEYDGGEKVVPWDYTAFRVYCETIEETCRKKLDPMPYTLMGKILVEREKKPILTKSSLANADLILYQLLPIFDLNTNSHGYWYPMLYIYHRGVQPIWQKMCSVEYCERIKDLFGAKTIDEMKRMISENTAESVGGYQRCFDSPNEIRNSIQTDSIATVK